MTEPDYTESTKLYKAYLDKKDEAKKAAHPFEVEASKLYEAYEVARFEEIIKAMQSGYRRTDLNQLLEAIDIIARGYFPDTPEVLGSSGRAKYICAFCPYFDYGCGRDWPCCKFPKKYGAKCKACSLVRKFVTEDELDKTLKSYSVFRGFPDGREF